MSCLFILLLILTTSAGCLSGQSVDNCPKLRCKKHGPIVRFPFFIKGRHHESCGYPSAGFELSCSKTNDTILVLPDSVMLYVSNINYRSQRLDAHDPNDCFIKQFQFLNLSASPFSYDMKYALNVTIFNCSRYDNSSTQGRGDCLVDSSHPFVTVKDSMDELEGLVPCSKMFNISLGTYDVLSNNFITLEWSSPECRRCEAKGKLCRLNTNSSKSQTQCLRRFPGKSTHKQKMVETDKQQLHRFSFYLYAGAVVGSCSIAVALIVLYTTYTSDKTERENQLKIKNFLEDYKALKPSRYSYSDIKRITDEFSDEVGQGAYGTVYKGKLSNEILVAVKVLNNTNGNGEDFINEVGTIGKIHHVNIVRLVGYCADGSKRALVYEYFQNGSLQKSISSSDNKTSFLGWKKLQDIALGIAKGVEYLHQGCDQRILHFDIKPNNILLDQNFNPKISDFGLAKLCSKDQSIVSMTTARGTIGYIAPEVFSRNFGNVSYKSDVYSFGMLLLEMVGGTKVANYNDEIYFPQWIYNLLEKEEDLRIEIEEEGDAKIAKKLAIVGLQCIQWHPTDRPSMKIVVQMLEGEDGNLTLPPNPFASTGPTRNPAGIHGRNTHPELDVIRESEEENEIIKES